MEKSRSLKGMSAIFLLFILIYVVACMRVLCYNKQSCKKEVRFVDCFSVLNYQGSKKNLLEFIHKNTADYIRPGASILDIFSGTCSVGYSFKRTHRVFANDSELYSYVISTALLHSYQFESERVLEKLKADYQTNRKAFRKKYIELEEQEQSYLKEENTAALIKLYGTIPTVWNGTLSAASSGHPNYELFVSYYAGTYFGLRQAMEIDSLRYAIEAYREDALFYPMLTALFYAMKECVFSKDGHMAQPLDPENNQNKLLIRRKRSVVTCFCEKLRAFASPDFVNTDRDNRVYQLNFEELLKREEIKREIDFIYADPPYTDMQYSRYYHLLNTVVSYGYPALTKSREGYTKGLYTEGRFQSQLSTKSTCLKSFGQLIDFAGGNRKNLAVSFAYPKDTAKQKTDRYVMSIDDLTAACRESFGTRHVEVVSLDYAHSNNRNSKPKKVLEYLILCRGDRG